MPAALAGLGVVGLIVIGALFAFGGDNDSSSGPGALREAGCTLQAFPAQSRDHVQELPENFKYNSSPPTSGPHHPQPAPFDVYEEPVEQFRLVHNLEHGAVAIQYGERVPEATVARLQEYYREDPNGLIVAPHPRLNDEIALTAWTHLAKGKRFDAADRTVQHHGFRSISRWMKSPR